MKLGMGNDDRHVQSFRGVQDRVDALQIGGIERTDRALLFFRQFQNFNQIHKHDFFLLLHQRANRMIDLPVTFINPHVLFVAPGIGLIGFHLPHHDGSGFR